MIDDVIIGNNRNWPSRSYLLELFVNSIEVGCEQNPYQDAIYVLLYLSSHALNLIYSIDRLNYIEDDIEKNR